MDPQQIFYDVDPQQIAEAPTADESDTVEVSPVQAEPIEVHVPAASPSSAMPEPEDHVVPSNGHSGNGQCEEKAPRTTNGHHSGFTDQPAEELSAEAEEGVHRGLNRIVGNQVMLETYMDDRLATAQANNRQKATASLRRPKTAALTDIPAKPAQTPNPTNNADSGGLDDILHAVQRENLGRIEAQKKGANRPSEG